MFVSLMVFLAFCCWLWSSHTKRRRSAPPGPPSFPLLGILPQLLARSDHVRLFFDWSFKYGEIVSFSICGNDNILVTSADVARELLDKRGSIYADRPPMVSMNALLGSESAMVSMRYGQRFRKQRRMMQPLVSEKALLAYRRTLVESSADLVQSLMESPEKFEEHLDAYAALIFKVTYGLDYKSSPEIADIAHEALTRILPAFKSSGNLVDIFPVLRFWPSWAPFSQWKREAEGIRDCVKRAHGIPYAMVKDNMRAGDAEECLVLNAINSAGGLDQLSVADEADIRGVAGILYLAAQETTVSMMHAYIFALVLFPDMQRKVQAELDKVVPHGLPGFEDRKHLPYLEAVFKELYRWASPLVMTPPHVALADDVYEGYVIRRGTAVMANVYAMFQKCPSPRDFKAERFIDGTDLGEVPAEPRDLVFGFGRRRCPGIHVADRMLWLSMAQIAAKFEFLPPLVNGKVCMPVAEFDMTMIGLTVENPKPSSVELSQGVPEHKDDFGK